MALARSPGLLVPTLAAVAVLSLDAGSARADPGDQADAVFVHLTAAEESAPSPERVQASTLRIRASDGGGWTVACVAPCDRLLPRDARYQVEVPGRRPSATFALQAQKSEGVDVRAEPSRLGLVLGIPLMAVGALGTYGGAKLWISASNAPDSVGANAVRYVIAPPILVGGVAMVLAGLILPFVDFGVTVSQRGASVAGRF